MKNFFLLLILAGLLFSGWVYRDKLASIVKRTPPSEETAETAPAEEPAISLAPRTPHPAKEAQLAAAKAYPALTIPNSAFNQKFLALHAEVQRTEPELLTRADWPLKIAERTAVALGGGAMPVSGGSQITPKPLTGSALDYRPKKKH